MTESAGRGPFHRIVVLGESNAYGMCASRHAYEWNAVLGRLMEDFQDGESELLIVHCRPSAYRPAARATKCRQSPACSSATAGTGSPSSPTS